MEQPIKWLNGGCLIDGKVWVVTISPIHTPGLGYEMQRAIFGTEEEWLKAQPGNEKQVPLG